MTIYLPLNYFDMRNHIRILYNFKAHNFMISITEYINCCHSYILENIAWFFAIETINKRH